MHAVLEQRPEFSAWNLAIASKPEEAEVKIEWLEKLPQTTASVSEFTEENGIARILKIRMPSCVVILSGVPLEGPG